MNCEDTLDTFRHFIHHWEIKNVVSWTIIQLRSIVAKNKQVNTSRTSMYDSEAAISIDDGLSALMTFLFIPFSPQID